MSNTIQLRDTQGNAKYPVTDASLVIGMPTALSDLTADSTHRTVTDTEKATWNAKYTKPAAGIPATDLASGVIPDVSGKYEKPSTGIPKTDFASGVQDSLDLADSALQYTPSGEIDPDITPANYATREELTQLEAKVDMSEIQGDITFEKALTITGAEEYNSQTGISPFIDVSADRHIVVAPGASLRYCGYNASKEFVDYYSATASGSSRTLPSSVYYIRITFSLSNLSDVYVKSGGVVVWFPVISWGQRMDNAEKEIAKRKLPAVTASDFVSGKMWSMDLSVGDTAPSTMSNSGSITGTRLRVMRGMSFLVTMKVGSSANSRGYALTDKQLKILEISAQNEALTDKTILVTEDGWLYFNTNDAASASIILQNTVLDVYEELIKDLPKQAPKYINAPFPRGKETLKVLAIGNSFTVDATQYISELMSAANNDPSKLGLYRMYSGGATIDFYVSELDTENAWEAHLTAGNIPMTTTGTLAQIVAQDWDVIIIQQASDVSFDWDTYSKLSDYVRKLRMLCTNPNVCLGWHLVWGHIQTPSAATGLTDVEELAGNIYCCKRVAGEVGIDFIIPVGTAIQDARGTSLQTAWNMTRDDWHLANGTPYYVAACVWYAMLIAPLYGTPMYGNPAVHPITPGSSEDRETSVPVTASNRELCQRCAMYAIADMYDVVIPDE